MNEHPSPLSEAEKEELSAYLDGELNEEQVRAVEAKLGRDSRVRAEVNAMRAAWDLLDYLPSPEPSATFTHRTVEQASYHPASTGSLWNSWRPWALASVWAAAIVLMGLTGYWSTSSFLSKQPTDEELARDLRILEHYRLYQAVDDLDFLKKLASPDLFGDDNTDS